VSGVYRPLSNVAIVCLLAAIDNRQACTVGRGSETHRLAEITSSISTPWAGLKAQALRFGAAPAAPEGTPTVRKAAYLSMTLRSGLKSVQNSGSPGNGPRRRPCTDPILAMHPKKQHLIPTWLHRDLGAGCEGQVAVRLHVQPKLVAQDVERQAGAVVAGITELNCDVSGGRRTREITRTCWKMTRSPGVLRGRQYVRSSPEWHALVGIPRLVLQWKYLRDR
jgi:hypothetical protein